MPNRLPHPSRKTSKLAKRPRQTDKEQLQGCQRLGHLRTGSRTPKLTPRRRQRLEAAPQQPHGSEQMAAAPRGSIEPAKCPCARPEKWKQEAVLSRNGSNAAFSFSGARKSCSALIWRSSTMSKRAHWFRQSNETSNAFPPTSCSSSTTRNFAA